MFDCGCLLRTPSSGCLLRTPSSGYLLRTPSCGWLLRTPNCGCLLRTPSSGCLPTNAHVWMFTEDIQLWMFTENTQLWMLLRIFNCGCLLRTPCFGCLLTKYSPMGVLLLIPDCECLITNPERQTPSCGSLMTSTQLVVEWQTPNCRCLMTNDCFMTNAWLDSWWQVSHCFMTDDWLFDDRWLTVSWQIAWLAPWWQAVWWQMLDWTVQVLHQEILTRIPVLALQQTLNSLCLLGMCVLWAAFTVWLRALWVSGCVGYVLRRKKSRIYILLCRSCSGCVLERCEIDAVSAILSTGSKWHCLCFHFPVTDGLHLCVHSGGSWGRTVRVDRTMWITTPGRPPGNGRNPCHQGRLRWRVPCCLFFLLLSTPFTTLLYLYRLILWTWERLYTWGGLKCAFVCMWLSRDDCAAVRMLNSSC